MRYAGWERAAAAVLALLLAPAALRGQEAAGPLRGRVVEAGTGAAVAGAVVQLEGPRRASVVSGPDGGWRIEALPAGAYRVRVRHPAYAERELAARVPSGGTEHRVVLTPAALPLEALVVTASRRTQRLADAPVAIELLTRREIEQARVADLATLLVERLGIQLEGGLPAGEGVMLQGFGAERVLILLDGQPLVGRLSGQMDLSRIPTSMVERVEVMKGPQSSLYGSEAMGGVVNVITRRATGERWRLGLDLTGGSQGRADAAATVGGTLGAADYLAEAGRRATDLAPGRADTAGARAERWDALLKLGWRPLPPLRLEASALLLDERQRWRSGQIFSFADNRQASARLGAEWARGPHRLAPTLYLAEFDHLARSATSPTPVAGSGERERQRLWEGELLYNLVRGEQALDVGVEAKREEIVSDRVRGGTRTLHTLEPFAQATWALGAWRLVPGARATWSEQWGTYVTPRLAVLVRPAAGLAVRGSLGRGYRAPAFKELHMEFLNVGPGYGYTVRGNPALQPETSTNLSLGAEWSPGRVFLRGQFFQNRFDDFIETQLAGDSSGITVYTYGNIADGFTRGLEVEGGLTWGGLRAEAGYGYLQAEDAGTGQALLGRPRHSGRASLEAPLPLALRGALTGVYTGATPVRRTDVGVVERDSFLRFDLRLARALPGGLELALGARNLFDTQPDEWPGFTGRHLYLGIGWRTAGAPAPAATPIPH